MIFGTLLRLTDRHAKRVNLQKDPDISELSFSFGKYMNIFFLLLVFDKRVAFLQLGPKPLHKLVRLLENCQIALGLGGADVLQDKTLEMTPTLLCTRTFLQSFLEC